MKFLGRVKVATVILCLNFNAGAPAAAKGGEKIKTVYRQIVERGTIDVCMWPDYHAASYRNPRNRVLSEIDIYMAHAFRFASTIPHLRSGDMQTLRETMRA